MKHLILLAVVLALGGCSQAPNAPRNFYVGHGREEVEPLAFRRLSQEIAKDATAKMFVVHWGLVSETGKINDMEMTYDRTTHTITLGVYRPTNVTDKSIHIVAAKQGRLSDLWLYGGATRGSRYKAIP